MRRLVAALTLACSLTLAAGCGAESSTAPVVVITSVAGTWDLASVNSQPLPFTFQASDPRLELVAKQFVITDAGAFTYSFTVRATDLDGTVTTTKGTDSGTDVLADNVVTFRFASDGTTLTALVASARAMTIGSGAFSQAFTKR